MKDCCRIQLFKAYSEEFVQWRKLKLRRIDLSTKEVDVGALYKVLGIGYCKW